MVQLPAGWTAYHYEVLDSTNEQAKRLAKEGAADAVLLWTEVQTNGRGRRGRVWETSAGETICMSLLLRPEFSPQWASMLTLVMGLSVVQALEKEFGVKTQIKWPNDVVLNQKKVSGILTEMELCDNMIDYIVIGVGINTNQTEFAQELRDKATSLRLELGICVEQERLIGAVVESFWKNYQIFLETLDLRNLKDAYEAVMVNQNQPVRVLQPGNIYEGVAVGINAKGELLVERADGVCEKVYAGEVSVRGLYSYV